jgi:hypothetical protein
LNFAFLRPVLDWRTPDEAMERYDQILMLLQPVGTQA